MTQEYLHFIECFEKLSPYELDHFCRAIHQHYRTTLSTINEKDGVAERDFKEIIVRAMQATQIELAEQKVTHPPF